MSEYRIEDIKLGNHYIVKAYKGDDLIFDRNAEPYIATTGGDLEASYIAIDNPTIPFEWGDTVILDFEPPSSFANKEFYNCIIGGGIAMESSAVVSSGEFHYGFHLSYRERASENPRIIMGANSSPSNNWSHLVSYTFTPGIRQTLECLMTPPYQDGSWMRDRVDRTSTPPNIVNPVPTGFYLFGFKKMFKRTSDTEVVPGKRYFHWIYSGGWKYEEIANPTGDPSTQVPIWQELDGGVYICDNDLSCMTGSYCGKFYRITIKDSDNNLKYDFKPDIQNNHIGMIDLVSGTFYPCNDDTKFRIGR